MRRKVASNMTRKGGMGWNQSLLLQRLKHCNKRLASLDDAISYLRSTFPNDYGRIKEHAFIINVSQALQQLHRHEEISSSDERPLQKRQRQNGNTSKEESKDPAASSSSLNASSSQLDSLRSVSGSESESESADENIKAGFDKVEKGPWFSNIGGMDEVLKNLTRRVIFPMRNPAYYCRGGASPLSGILLHGPPGCGKTMLARAIANEAGVPFYFIPSTQVVSGVSGASEEHIRSLFNKAYRTAPSIICFDEIDSIASKREGQQKQMECRIVTQLITCMDEFCEPHDNQHESKGSHSKLDYVLVIGTTNKPDTIDPALRRRFEREIAIDVPDESTRIQILSALTRTFSVDTDFDPVKIARATPGFVGSDLKILTKEAAHLAMDRDIDWIILDLCKQRRYRECGEKWWRHTLLPEEMKDVFITMPDFEEAVKIVKPSTAREGFSMIPNIKWEDVGGFDSIRQKLKFAIVDRIKDPKVYENAGMDLETGFLLYGPNGCGKTLIAQAVANEAGANFIYVKGAALLTKYVGESEMAVRTIFSRARKCAPCILFFDEIDGLATQRGNEGAWVTDRVVGQLLIELDGVEQRRGVYVIGATNRPKSIDEAILRPGRLGEHLYVPLPGPDDRGLILQTLARNKPIDPSMNLFEFGRSKSCENFNGANLQLLMSKAAEVAFKEKQSSPEGCSDGTGVIIKLIHFQQAVKGVKPAVSEEQRRYFEKLSRSF